MDYNNSKKYVSLNRLSNFLDNLKTLFAKKSDLDSLEVTVNTKTSPAGKDFGTVMSGGNVDIESGVITVKDNAHNHIVNNITGLQDVLNTKSEIGHGHDDMYYTESEIDTKILEINASIENITSGDVVVAKANEAVEAETANTAISAQSAIQDGDGNIIKDVYETKSDASSKLSEAKSYADGIKNDLLNGAGGAYDTLKELGDLIDDNTDAIDALEIVAAGKANKVHSHEISDVNELQDSLDSKANASDFNSHVDEFDEHKKEFDTHVSNFNTHTSNKDNPHEVTTSQIGAMAITDYDSTSEIKEAGGIVDWANNQYEKKVDGVVASSLAIGSPVFLNVDGVPTEFIVVHQGNPDTSLYDVSCNGTWLLMKDSYVQYMPFDTDENNIYSSSDIHNYLNSDFYNLLDDDTQAAVKQVKIPYVSDVDSEIVSSGSSGLSAKVFILGAREIGNNDDGVLVDGATLSYFETGADNLRIAKYKGEDSWWWTRTSVGTSVGTAYENCVVSVFFDGAFSYAKYGASDDVRPALILNSDLIINPETGETKAFSGGDMKASDYDPTGEIISAGGIVEWFNVNGSSNAGGGNAGGGATSGNLASDLKIGSSVFFNVNNVPTEFIVVHQGNPDVAIYDASCDGTWFMAKDIYDKKAMSTVYTSSDVHDYLNGTFFNMLDEDIRINIKQIKLPYTEWTTVHTGADGVPTRVFIPSRNEINFGNVYDSVIDGAILSYFDGATDSFRVANYDGAAGAWWTRTAYTQSAGNAHSVSSSGSWGGSAISSMFGVRPMFILSSDYDFAKNNDSSSDNQEEKPFNGQLISSLPVGKSVLFKVDNILKEFLVVQQGNPNAELYDGSCDGTWFMAKDVYCESKYNSITTNASSSYYDESDVHDYLNGTFLNLLEENIRLNIIQAKIPYVSYKNNVVTQNYGEDGILAKAFILDAQEMGYNPDDDSLDDYRGEASVLDYFEGATNSTRITNYNGMPIIYWTRSYCTEQYDDYTGDHKPHVFTIYNDGQFARIPVSELHGIRPVFILPSDMYVDVDTGIVSDTEDNNSGSSSNGSGSSSGGSNNDFDYEDAMLKSVYDPTGEVEFAGGLVNWFNIKNSEGGDIEVPSFDGELLSSLPVGKTVIFNIDGIPTEFLVIQQGNPSTSVYDASCNGTWFMAKDVYSLSKFNSLSTNAASNYYHESDIHDYLSGTFLDLLDEDVRLNIVQAKIPYVSYTSVVTQNYGANGLPSKVFILDAQEMGLDPSSVWNNDYRGKAAVLSYFNGATDSTRIAKYNGSAYDYWTRSYSTSDDYAYAVNTSGGFSTRAISSSQGVRPVFILPSDLYMDVNTGAISFNSVGGISTTLPEYTKEDEGKILCIVNGIPAWVDISTLT